ncbi:MAG: alkaline phosphatase family protein [Bacteroidota bacterium]
MKKIIFLLGVVILSACKKEEFIIDSVIDQKKQSIIDNELAAFPVPAHIIFVWFENKDYSQIIGSSSAPFINSLISKGTLFTNSHALGHPSYPEYIAFFAGTKNGKTNNDCIAGAPYSNANLYTQLKAKGKSFSWYSEDLPVIGSKTCNSGAYTERHNPTQCFSNVPSTANKRWSDFPTNFSSLERVVCITPNLDHDMHDGSISQGDNWLKNNCTNLINWCKTNNSVFVVYFDENNGIAGNRIPVIAVGQPVKVNYRSTVYYDHYNWTRTILAFYGPTQIANSTSRQTITDCWR